MTEKEKPVVVEPPKNIYARMLDVMTAISYVRKGDKQVNGQYNYVSHDSVVAAIRPHLIANGIAVESRILEKSLELQEITETVMIYDKSKGAKVPLMQDGKPVEKNTMGYVCTVFMEFCFINIDNPADRMTAQGFGMGIDTQDKATGKAVSYAKKYALLSALLLETGDDPERDVDFAVGAKKKAPKTPDTAKPEAPAKKDPWPTAAARKAAFNQVMEELNKVKSKEDLGLTWVANTELIKQLKQSDEQIFLELEKRKDSLKQQFNSMEQN